jgi:hypothetical protein
MAGNWNKQLYNNFDGESKSSELKYNQQIIPISSATIFCALYDPRAIIVC